MSRLVIELDEATGDLARSAAAAHGTSPDAWVRQIIQENASEDAPPQVAEAWPREVIEAASTWTDFPSPQDLRKIYGPDLPYEPLRPDPSKPDQWPQDFLDLAGAFPDWPIVEQLRADDVPDAPREEG